MILVCVYYALTKSVLPGTSKQLCLVLAKPESLAEWSVLANRESWACSEWLVLLLDHLSFQTQFWYLQA